MIYPCDHFEHWNLTPVVQSDKFEVKDEIVNQQIAVNEQTHRLKTKCILWNSLTSQQ